MDSINKNQPEDNFKNLFGEDAVQKVKTLAEKASSCFFCTNNDHAEGLFATRPMAPELIDGEGNFWFLSADDSHKNRELAADPTAQLLFQGSSYSDYLSLHGIVSISRDKAMIHKLWDSMMKTWFTEGEDDPRITVLKFTPTGGYYWDTKHSMAIALVKRAFGAIVGQTYDDSVEGEIKI